MTNDGKAMKYILIDNESETTQYLIMSWESDLKLLQFGITKANTKTVSCIYS